MQYIFQNPTAEVCDIIHKSNEKIDHEHEKYLRVVGAGPIHNSRYCVGSCSAFYFGTRGVQRRECAGGGGAAAQRE